MRAIHFTTKLRPSACRSVTEMVFTQEIHLEQSTSCEAKTTPQPVSGRSFLTFVEKRSQKERDFILDCCCVLYSKKLVKYSRSGSWTALTGLRECRVQGSDLWYPCLTLVLWGTLSKPPVWHKNMLHYRRTVYGLLSVIKKFLAEYINKASVKQMITIRTT